MCACMYIHMSVHVCMLQIFDEYQCGVEEQKQSVAMEKETSESKIVKMLVIFVIQISLALWQYLMTFILSNVILCRAPDTVGSSNAIKSTTRDEPG